jgi:hypothetical protein
MKGKEEYKKVDRSFEQAEACKVVGADHGLLRLRDPGHELRLAAPPGSPGGRAGEQPELYLKNVGSSQAAACSLRHAVAIETFGVLIPEESRG